MTTLNAIKLRAKQFETRHMVSLYGGINSVCVFCGPQFRLVTSGIMKSVTDTLKSQDDWFEQYESRVCCIECLGHLGAWTRTEKMLSNEFELQHKAQQGEQEAQQEEQQAQQEEEQSQHEEEQVQPEVPVVEIPIATERKETRGRKRKAEKKVRSVQTTKPAKKAAIKPTATARRSRSSQSKNKSVDENLNTENIIDVNMSTDMYTNIKQKRNSVPPKRFRSESRGSTDTLQRSPVQTARSSSYIPELIDEDCRLSPRLRPRLTTDRLSLFLNPVRDPNAIVSSTPLKADTPPMTSIPPQISMIQHESNNVEVVETHEDRMKRYFDMYKLIECSVRIESINLEEMKKKIKKKIERQLKYAARKKKPSLTLSRTTKKKPIKTQISIKLPKSKKKSEKNANKTKKPVKTVESETTVETAANGEQSQYMSCDDPEVPSQAANFAEPISAFEEQLRDIEFQQPIESHEDTPTLDK